MGLTCAIAELISMTVAFDAATLRNCGSESPSGIDLEAMPPVVNGGGTCCGWFGQVSGVRDIDIHLAEMRIDLFESSVN